MAGNCSQDEKESPAKQPAHIIMQETDSFPSAAQWEISYFVPHRHEQHIIARHLESFDSTDQDLPNDSSVMVWCYIQVRHSFILSPGSGPWVSEALPVT